MRFNVDEKIMTLPEVAELLRVHPSTLYKLIRRKQIPAFRIGSDYRFHRVAIDAWRLNGGVQQSEE
jgi:excisionase family DNA binding protein